MAAQKKEESVEREIGKLLKKTRLSKKLTVREVSKHLNIRVVYLDALEKGDFDAIGAPVYLFGFLRTYATFLGIDASDLQGQYLKETGILKQPNSLPDTESKTDCHLSLSNPFPSISIIFISLSILVVLLLAWYFYNPFSAKEPIVKEKASLASLTEEKSAPSPIEKAPNKASVPVHNTEESLPESEGSSKKSISDQKAADLLQPSPPFLKASEEVWIAFEDEENKRIFSKTMQPEQLIAVPKQAIFLVVGNAGGVALYPTASLDESIRLGKRGEVHRHKLEKLLAQNSAKS